MIELTVVVLISVAFYFVGKEQQEIKNQLADMKKQLQQLPAIQADIQYCMGQIHKAQKDSAIPEFPH